LLAAYLYSTWRSLLQASLEVTDAEGWTVVAIAAAAGHTRLVQCLLDANGSPNAKTKATGRTPLMAAAQGGHRAAAQLLLEHMDAAPGAGASPGGSNPIDVRDCAGVTALMLAAKNAHAATVELLLDADADANLLDQQSHCALELTARRGSVAAATSLLAHGRTNAVRGRLESPQRLRCCMLLCCLPSWLPSTVNFGLLSGRPTWPARCRSRRRVGT